MPIGRWIYEKTNTSGGGGVVVAPDAPPVVPGVGTAREIYNGLFEVDVPWTAGAGASPDNFAGVAVFLEDPDISTLAEAPLNGTASLDGTSQVSGKWQPVRETDSFTSPAVLQVDGQPAARDIRVYLQAYGKVTNATLVRANKTGATPSVKVTIPAAAGSYVSGQEYAWLITNPSVVTVPDFDNPAGPQYYFTFNYTAPDPSIPLPPGLQPFAGVQTVYEYQDGRRAQAVFLAVNKPDTWISDEYSIGATQTYIIYFCSTDAAGNVNSIVPHLTPSISVTITYPPAGQATAPDVGALTLTNSRFEPEPDGTIWALADVAWTNPTSPRYAGMNLYRVDVQPPIQMAVLPAPLNHKTLYVNNWPKVVQAWTLAGISYDQNGKPAADPTQTLPPHIPLVTWNIGPPGTGSQGQENTSIGGAASATVTTEQMLNSDGVVMMRHHIAGWTNPTDNTFGGMSVARAPHGSDPNSASPANAPAWWDAPKGATTLVTDWEPAPAATAWDFYFVSRDMLGHRNTIFVGFTPELANITFTPMAGNIIPSRMPSGWWDTSEFQWPAYPNGAFQALQFVAQKIFVGSILRIGGGSGTDAASFAGQQNGQIAVYNASNVLRAWVGEQDGTSTPGNTNPHSIYGGWFGELYVGGDGPPTAPIYAQNDGTVIIGGFEMTGNRYPYISLRDNTGVEVGRMGARIGYAATGNQSGAEVTIQGAWFREFAYGGQSFTDWRMLAKMDPTNPQGASVQMRNVNLFTIDYMQNYPSASNPNNAAVTLKFGYDAFFPLGSGTNFWKFPGITLNRTGTSQGAALIDRGLIITNPSGGQIAALVAFNGDLNGSDTPPTFWGVLTMENPLNGANNVTLSSGAASNGGSYLNMLDQSGNMNFSVGQAGDVMVRGSLSCGAFSMSGVLNCAGVTASGAISGSTLSASSTISASGSITSQSSFWIGGRQVIDNTGQFIGPNVNTAGTVAGSLLFSSGNIETDTGTVIGATFAAHGQGNAATQDIPSPGSVRLRFINGLFYGTY